jgi:hypothetical protein
MKTANNELQEVDPEAWEKKEKGEADWGPKEIAVSEGGNANLQPPGSRGIAVLRKCGRCWAGFTVHPTVGML